MDYTQEIQDLKKVIAALEARQANNTTKTAPGMSIGECFKWMHESGERVGILAAINKRK